MPCAPSPKSTTRPASPPESERVVTGQITRGIIVRDTYRDSVFLMRVSSKLRAQEGIAQAEILTGTPSNLEALHDHNLLPCELADAQPGPSDLLIAVRGTESSVERALGEARKLIDMPHVHHDANLGRGSADRSRAHSLRDALEVLPDANLALISVPGPHVRSEAMAALRRGLNLLIFSSNVDIDDELAIKREAEQRGLLVMGPDCGTAMFRGIGLGFANAVRSGPVGLVGASGTGLQQVSTLIHQCGCGISHIIGTGGGDVGPEIAGQMTLSAMDLLDSDPETRVLVVVSKPPHPRAVDRIVDRAQQIGKPVVVCFLGSDTSGLSSNPPVHAATLEDAALIAVSLAEDKRLGEVREIASALEPDQDDVLAREASYLTRDQRFVRGLFCGGTFALEAAFMLKSTVGDVSGNFRAAGIEPIDDSIGIAGHGVLDLGAESLTRGRPHPMLAPDMREAHILSAASDSSVAVVMLDFVLGYGSHPDPAGSTVPMLRRMSASAAEHGRHIAILATVCGTDRDPQGLYNQVRTLRDIGAVVTCSSTATVRNAARLLNAKRP